MKVSLDSATERRIRDAVEPGDPWAVDELTEEICGEDPKLHGGVTEIVADEYRRRLSARPRQAARERERRCYKEPNDADKDWLLGEIVESVGGGKFS